ncbi:hypothetical protein [Frigoriglobus tundricola]|uniref:SGNH/GDSL hydrolase family protein n=1 Tax=Frigoriglobus tundricola TaxID=2774151 RepID=A0A6M5YRF4_9BACT|nr:hypothetical protein [Frigoriglobus tundricola]QJW96529.1 hypothetical protein FTUN_4086 [Frigoriglobus tundricola]
MLLFPPAFVLVLLGVWAAVEAAVPEITDTDYFVRLRVVKATAADHPDRPLGVVIGSSRVLHGFQPEQMPDEPGGPVWVSAAHMGAGPSLTRLILHNLLRDGVRPAAVVIELMPTFFTRENEGFVCAHFALADMPLVHAYSDAPFGYEYHFLRHRFKRIGDLARADDPFAGQEVPLPRGGRSSILNDLSPEDRARYMASAMAANGAVKKMAVRPAADRAFRDTLREAAEHGIPVVLLRMPEGPVFRSWYDPDGLRAFDEYVARTAGEFGTPVIDARFWLDDENDFYDSHHLLKGGGAKFTARFARELSAALAGR